MRAPGLCALLFCGCASSAGGPDYAQVEVRASRPGATTEPEHFCVTLPVLPGAHTEQAYDFEGGFRATARADRDQVEVSFGGIIDPASAASRVTAERLNEGYSRSFSVRTSAGADYSIVVASGCAPASVAESP
jgi:hypothetical protein